MPEETKKSDEFEQMVISLMQKYGYAVLFGKG